MSTVAKPFTFSSGATILASEHNDNFDTLYNDYNGNITNANISASAAIANSKLNLATVSQAITFTGNNTFAGTTIADLGTVTTADINGGTIDGATLGGAAQVTVTDADINGGTMDGVQIGGVTATGELIVNDSSDNAAGLGSQGTSGQVLTSAGAGANPTFSNQAYQLIDTTTMSTDTNSGNITIAANKFYKVVITLLGSTTTNVGLAFNDDNAGSNYDTVVSEVTYNTPAVSYSGGTAQPWVRIGNSADTHSITLTIDTYKKNADSAFVTGQNTTEDNAQSFSGFYDTDATISSFEILVDSGTATGTIFTYELGQ